MYVATVPNRASPPAILLRESYRQAGKVKSRTLANLSHWPEQKIDALRAVLRGQSVAKVDQAFSITRSLPHGHVAAVLGMLRKLGLDKMIAPRRSKRRDQVLAMIVARIIDPLSKLATARGLDDQTRSSSLAETLALEDVDEHDLYAAMDWLIERQAKIEDQLAARHLSEGTLVLYDLSSSYYEGSTCPLIAFGHDRDGKKGKRQIVWGLMCDSRGCPVAVQVFKGNTSDPKTLKSQMDKLRVRFALQRVILVGDRGMITAARIEQDLKPAGIADWITALRAPSIRQLISSGAIQMSLFDQRDLAEITHEDYPDERLIVCHNPLLDQERKRKRQELLRATEKELDKIVLATRRRRQPLQGKDQIGLRVGKVLGRYKMAKHFNLTISATSFDYQPDEARIAAEEQLDGLYVIRTTVPADEMDSHEVVRGYKSLSAVERAFRSMKTVDLKVRPIHHRLPNRVRAHVLLCMLAYYVEWHMRQALAPILFDDEDQAAAEAQRSSVVAKAQRSPSAQRKAQRKRTEDDLPVHSFQTLLKDLATLTKNHLYFDSKQTTTSMLAEPTQLQARAFELLGVPLTM
jgi:transposase